MLLKNVEMLLLAQFQDAKPSVLEDIWLQNLYLAFLHLQNYNCNFEQGQCFMFGQHKSFQSNI